MYNLATNVFKIAHSKTGRTFFVKMIFSSGLELSGADCEIFSMKISRGNENADDITFGDVSSAIATIEMSYDSTVISSVKEGMTVNVEIGLDTGTGTPEYIPMGEFKVISLKRNGKQVSLMVADKLYESDTVYTSTLTFPNTAQNVVAEIRNDLGFSGIDSSDITLSDMQIESLPANITKRQMISYIASYFGKNAYVDRSGRLVFDWYDFTSPVTVTDDEIETPTIGETISINALACATDKETILTSGTGRAMTFENPYMTQSRLDSLRREFSYVPCEMKQLIGSVLLDYDVLQYGDSLIPIMSSELYFDGGVTLSVKAAGKTEEESAKKTLSPIDVVFEQVKHYADDAIKHTTDIMNGINGGYKIEKYDADGTPFATIWMDAAKEEDTTHCIMINKEGIGFGYKNPDDNTWIFQQGWLIDGTFNTEFITTHELSLTGSLKNAKNTIVEETEFDLNYELSNNIQIPTANGETFDAVGLQLYSKPKDEIKSNVFYTNWGAFFDANDEDSAVTALLLGIKATLGKLNFYGGQGFYLAYGDSVIAGFPDSGFSSTKGFRSDGPFETKDGFYVNGVPCATADELAGYTDDINNVEKTSQMYFPLSSTENVDLYNAFNQRASGAFISSGYIEDFEGNIFAVQRATPVTFSGASSAFLPCVATRSKKNNEAWSAWNTSGSGDGIAVNVSGYYIPRLKKIGTDSFELSFETSDPDMPAGDVIQMTLPPFPAASAETLGGIKIGDDFNISKDGKLSLANDTYGKTILSNGTKLNELYDAYSVYFPLSETENSELYEIFDCYAEGAFISAYTIDSGNGIKYVQIAVPVKSDTTSTPLPGIATRSKREGKKWTNWMTSYSMEDIETNIYNKYLTTEIVDRSGLDENVSEYSMYLPLSSGNKDNADLYNAFNGQASGVFVFSTMIKDENNIVYAVQRAIPARAENATGAMPCIATRSKYQGNKWSAWNTSGSDSEDNNNDNNDNNDNNVSNTDWWIGTRSEYDNLSASEKTEKSLYFIEEESGNGNSSSNSDNWWFGTRNEYNSLSESEKTEKSLYFIEEGT